MKTLRMLIAASLSVVLLLPLKSLAAKETKLYDALGVPPDADDTLIKKAYRKAALWVPLLLPNITFWIHRTRSAFMHNQVVCVAYEVT